MSEIKTKIMSPYKDTIIIVTPNEPEVDDTPSFNGTCNVCEENEAKILVRTDNCLRRIGHTLKEEVCFGCYSAPDYQVILKKSKIISTTLI